MFTGIVKGVGTVTALDRRAGLHTLTVELPGELSEGVEPGCSISVDGVCLTVSSFDGPRVTFDAMQETLQRTTLGALQAGSRVNIERAAAGNAEVGGHVLSGHIDCTAEIIAIETPENNYLLRFRVPDPWMRYIFQKGYVALNGASLTVSAADKKEKTFEVWFIPETLRRTTFGEKKIGDFINLEVERTTQVIVETVWSFLEEKFGGDPRNFVQ